MLFRSQARKSLHCRGKTDRGQIFEQRVQLESGPRFRLPVATDGVVVGENFLPRRGKVVGVLREGCFVEAGEPLDPLAGRAVELLHLFNCNGAVMKNVKIVLRRGGRVRTELRFEEGLESNDRTGPRRFW